MKPSFISPPTPMALAQQAQARLMQGWALHQQGQLAQAAQLYEQVLKLQPKNFDALHLSGVAALQSGDFKRAVDQITKALKIDRNNASAYNNRGAAYAELRELDFALLNYDKAIALQADFANAYNNRGNVRARLDQYELALADFDKAIALQPDYHEAYHNRGNTLSGLHRYEDALASFQRALDLNPTSAQARWNLGMCQLRVGDFANGWANSEARMQCWAKASWHDAPPETRWTGAEPLQGKTIVLRCEQGLGDTIQFARYASLLAPMAAQVVLEVQPPLLPLLQHLPGVTLLAQGSDLPPHDYFCPLLSLPLALKTDLSNIPPPPGHIASEAGKLAQWQSLLGPKTKPRIGIVWSGNPAHVDDHKRSVALSTFVQILSDDVDWISLHKDVRDSDLAILSKTPAIRQFGAQLHDFTDTAALCDLLDLVICVDTSVAHLAASMGKPVWLLLAYNADWRWLRDRTDSPWYPCVKLYRQTAAGDWAGVLRQVKNDVQQRFTLPA